MKAYCTLRNGTLRNETKRNESVLCEMEICTLRNENLYFAKWNLYFAKWNLYFVKWNLYFAKWNSYSVIFHEKLLWRSFCEPSIYLQSWPWHTFFIFVAAGEFLHWALCFLHNCFRLLVGRLCFVLLRDDYINPDKFDISMSPSRPE